MLPKNIKTSGFPSAEATCRKLGMTFDPWQTDLNRAILGKRRDGSYAADTVVMSIPRQVGKTWNVGALVFADCIIHPGTTVVWTAHRFKVARETFNELKGIAEGPALAPHIDRDAITTAAGNESIPFRNGSRIVFAARERGAIRGFTKVRRLILDEGQILTDAAMADLAPTMNQADNPQIVIMGTPPKPNDPGEVFTRLRREALDGTSSEVLYVEFSAPADADPDAHETWRIANPSYPRRTSAKAIQRMRKLLSPEDFLREALGIWDEDTENRLLPNWPACGVKEFPLEPVGAVGVAISHDRQWAAFGVADLRDGVMHVGTHLRQEGTAWVAAEARRIYATYGCPIIIDRRGPGADLIDDLQDANAWVVPAETNDYLDGCAQFFDAVAQERLVHMTNDTELNAAVAGAGKRAVMDRWAWSRRKSTGEVSVLEAVTLAAWGVNYIKGGVILR